MNPFLSAVAGGGRLHTAGPRQIYQITAGDVDTRKHADLASLLIVALFHHSGNRPIQ